jgi:hypothetical protein
MLREHHKLKMFDKQVAERIHATQKTEILRNCRKLLDEGICNLHSSPNTVAIIKSRMGLAGHVARMGNGEFM